MSEVNGQGTKGGRPAKEQKMRDYPVHVYLPSNEAVLRLKQAAEQEGMSLSTWARVVLVREAARILGE